MTRRIPGAKRGPPPKPRALLEAAIELVRGGARPEDAAAQVTREALDALPRRATDAERRAATISSRTLRRALPPGGPSAMEPERATDRLKAFNPGSAPKEYVMNTLVSTVNDTGPALPPAKLAALRELVARLPFAQQDAIVSTLPLDRLRQQAIARGLASHPAAAAAVMRELRAVTL